MVTKEKITEHELVELLQARKNMYQLLHLFFVQPITVETFHEIKKQNYFRDLSGQLEGAELTHRFFAENNAADAVELAREDYFRLFIGPGPLLAPPWESVYQGKDRCLFDVPTFEVRMLFEKFGLGLEKTPGQHDEADDHIIYELEFMIRLIERCEEEQDPSQLKELLNGQQAMLTSHLSQWVPQFAQDIQQGAQSDLMIGIAQMLEAYVQFDCENMNELVQAMGC